MSSVMSGHVVRLDLIGGRAGGGRMELSGVVIDRGLSAPNKRLYTVVQALVRKTNDKTGFGTCTRKNM